MQHKKIKTSVEIQNLKCGGCASTIVNKLVKIEGITDISVNTETSNVTVTYYNDTDLVKVKPVLNTIGYPIVGASNPLGTKAKSFVNCAIGRIKN